MDESNAQWKKPEIKSCCVIYLYEEKVSMMLEINTS